MDDARRAVPGDLPAIADLARSAIGELAVLRGGELWRAQLARQEPVEDTLAADLDAEPQGTAVVVGLVDGAVVGYGVCRIESLPSGGVLAVVPDLYVDPEARGIGVGEAMMNLLVAHAGDQGAVGIDSVALPGDRQTKNFFETFGLKARALVVHRSLVDPERADDSSA